MVSSSSSSSSSKKQEGSINLRSYCLISIVPRDFFPVTNTSILMFYLQEIELYSGVSPQCMRISSSIFPSFFSSSSFFQTSSVASKTKLPPLLKPAILLLFLLLTPRLPPGEKSPTIHMLLLIDDLLTLVVERLVR